MVLPVTTAIVERAFSTMNIMKTRLHNRIGDQWMNYWLISYIEKDVFIEMENDDIINKFQKMKTCQSHYWNYIGWCPSCLGFEIAPFRSILLYTLSENFKNIWLLFLLAIFKKLIFSYMSCINIIYLEKKATSEPWAKNESLNI